jgi:L-2-hydroxyglutarate oxidase LhgO
LNEVDCIVVGAGVIGLSVARAVARDHEVIVIERERHAGMHTSSRNSEVIHAGLHYPPGSLKARLCVLGRDLLYRYCEVHGIGYRRCGKLTVAMSAAEAAQLKALEANARACGVLDLEWLEGDELRRLEPELQCALALHSPATGIIDSHALMQCLLGDAESYGANVAFGTAVTALRPVASGIEVCVDSQNAPILRARWIVNCAGLFAAAVAKSIADFPEAAIPKIRYAKGSYFSLPGRAPFSHLIYPVPAVGGHLGVHLTLDLGGSARFGPDMQWLEGIDAAPDYAVDALRAPAFAAAIRQYWPDVPAARLAPAYAGVRPKLSGPGEAARDFLISGPSDHGVPGLVNLFGIESPGLTACLALGDMVAAMIEMG